MLRKGLTYLAAREIVGRANGIPAHFPLQGGLSYKEILTMLGGMFIGYKMGAVYREPEDKARADQLAALEAENRALKTLQSKCQVQLEKTEKELAAQQPAFPPVIGKR